MPFWVERVIRIEVVYIFSSFDLFHDNNTKYLNRPVTVLFFFFLLTGLGFVDIFMQIQVKLKNRNENKTKKLM